MYYAYRELAESGGFEPPDHEWSPGYRPGGINRSPNSPSVVRVRGLEPLRRKIVSGFKDRRVYQFRHTRRLRNRRSCRASLAWPPTSILAPTTQIQACLQIF